MDTWLMFSLALLVFTMGVHTLVARQQHCIKSGKKNNKVADDNDKGSSYKRRGFVCFSLTPEVINNVGGRIGLVLFSVVFYVYFWSQALGEYLKPPEEFLRAKNCTLTNNGTMS